ASWGLLQGQGSRTKYSRCWSGSVARIAIKSRARWPAGRGCGGLSLTQRPCGPDRAAGPCRLLDHLVGEREQLLGNCQAQRLGSRQIDDELKLGRLLDRNIGRVCSAQDLVDEVGGAAEHVGEACAVGNQAACGGVLARAMHRWQSRGQCRSVCEKGVGSEGWGG